MTCGFSTYVSRMRKALYILFLSRKPIKKVKKNTHTCSSVLVSASSCAFVLARLRLRFIIIIITIILGKHAALASAVSGGGCAVTSTIVLEKSSTAQIGKMKPVTGVSRNYSYYTCCVCIIVSRGCETKPCAVSLLGQKIRCRRRRRRYQIIFLLVYINIRYIFRTRIYSS